MKYLIVGLGNPGPEYANTRHNIGFIVLDALARASNIVFSPDRYGDRAELRHKGRTLILIKPSTFMNLSGKTVRYWMEQEKVVSERVLVITDDLALPFGKIRLRPSGGAGGHNGLTSIIELIGTETFPRLRFGIGSEFSRGRQADYVLSPWNKEEAAVLDERVKICGEAILDFGLMGIGHAMNTFNTR
ncbi:MAG: aminoacyl-tRNA hydrolase [Flavobacteriales bacterium]|nr:aminoacyl-tRNA hydrolase [Flavobacteriales bacterium]MBK9287455.1 aminoacyl-tRNA hydrolase [Flavobacteriales bacterium]MBL0036270.1 aminoacyl-tRNA hydrolase [Flavobacteriales bacterium]